MAFEEMPDWTHLKVNQSNGVTEVILHSDETSLVWNATAERELTELFIWLSLDRNTSVLILTGAGDRFCAEIDATEFRQMTWRDIWSGGRKMLCGLLDLDMLVIAAVNGPAFVHSEIPVMADIVIAAPEAEFADRAHFVRNVVPGDGVHIVWGDLLGPSRAGYFLLTGESVDANEARRLGFVHEIHPRNELLDRARVIAASLLEKSPAVISYTRSALRMRQRRNFREDVSYGLAIEGLAQHALGVRGPE